MVASELSGASFSIGGSRLKKLSIAGERRVRSGQSSTTMFAALIRLERMGPRYQNRGQSWAMRP